MVIDLRMTDQLQASFYRHDLAPFRHVSRRNIDHIAAFVPVMDIKAVILKDGAACGEGRCGERNGFPFMDQRAEDLEKGLETGPYYNVIRGADHISAFPDIVCENLPEIAFALGFAIRKHTVALAEGAFDVTLPQIKTEAFPVNTGRGKIIKAGRDILILFFGGKQMLLGSNAGDIIAALCPGDDVAVCCKQKIGIFDGGTAQLQLLGAFAEGGHFASGKETAFQDQLPIIVVNLQIKVFFFVFCGYI